MAAQLAGLGNVETAIDPARAAAVQSARLASLSSMRSETPFAHRLDRRRAVAAGEQLARGVHDFQQQRARRVGEQHAAAHPAARGWRERGCRRRRRSESANPWRPRGRSHRSPGRAMSPTSKSMCPRRGRSGQPLPGQLDQRRRQIHGNHLAPRRAPRRPGRRCRSRRRARAPRRSSGSHDSSVLRMRRGRRARSGGCG
jgi:hypothetical protein